MAKMKPQPLQRWWKYSTPTKGMVTRTLSPYELKIVEPLFENPMSSLKHRLEDFLPVVPGLVLLVGTVWGSEALYASWLYDERA
jgi:hypothetical protein